MLTLGEMWAQREQGAVPALLLPHPHQLRLTQSGGREGWTRRGLLYPVAHSPERINMWYWRVRRGG